MIDHDGRFGMSIKDYCEYANVPWEAAYFEYMEGEILDALGEGCDLRIDLDDLETISMDVKNAHALWLHLLEIGVLSEDEIPEWYCIRFRPVPTDVPNYWVGFDWRKGDKNAEIYITPRALPEEIDSVGYEYILDRNHEISYDPRDDYWEDLATSPDDPPEWATDEYGDSLYRILRIEDCEGLLRVLSPGE